MVTDLLPGDLWCRGAVVQRCLRQARLVSECIPSPPSYLAQPFHHQTIRSFDHGTLAHSHWTVSVTQGVTLAPRSSGFVVL